MKTVAKAVLCVGFAVLAFWGLATVNEMSGMLKDALTLIKVTREELATVRTECQAALQDMKDEMKKLHLPFQKQQPQEQVQIAR